VISSISNWFTNQKIAMIAAGMACIGCFGPALFDLAPPKYFASQPIVVERAGGAPDSSAPSMTVLEPSTPVSKKMVEQSKSSETPRKGLTSDLDNGGPKRQTDPLDTVKKRNDIIRSDDPVGGKMAQSAKPVKPVSPSKNSKGSKPLGLDSEPTVQAVRVAPLMVPRTFVRQIPTSHQSLSGSAQKASFLEIALPLILAGNEEVMRRREAIASSNQNDDRAKLEKWAYLYDIKVTNQDNSTLTKQLLGRADVIPVPIALAQAAIESGWGTSRFAIKGNALFGQWAWRDDAGLRPLSPTNERAVVRSFGTLSGSVRAYIHNLNTHPYYEGFRNARAALHDGPEENKTKVLVKHLDRYAAIGSAYVTKLENLIRTNQLGRYALAYLY
jgi:Bax protein